MDKNQIKICEELTVSGRTYRIVRLLGHGKGGYSYLAEQNGVFYVLDRFKEKGYDAERTFD